MGLHLATIDIGHIGIRRQLHREFAGDDGLAGAARTVQQANPVRAAQRRLQELQRIVMRTVLDDSKRIGVSPKRSIAQDRVILLHFRLVIRLPTVRIIPSIHAVAVRKVP